MSAAIAQQLVDNKRMRLSILKQCLELFKRNSQEFLRQIITFDKTWIHYYTPETKEVKTVDFIRQTCSEEDGPIDRKSDGYCFFGMCKASCSSTIWRSEKLLTGQDYTDLLTRFNIELKKKRPHLTKKNVVFRTMHRLIPPQ